MRFVNCFTSFSLIMFLLLLPLNTSLAISIPEEKKLADKFMEKIQKKQMILNDPIANNMITRVGNHILSFLPPQPFDPSFYIFDDDTFNAFASPGANIFFYRGLITSLDSIDELAGIVAHETAHASSRHVSESIDRSKIISIGSLAGILAGAILGSQSDGDAGSAVMTGSIALGHTTMLAFTRKNETEADEKGILFLKKSCFKPKGLLQGLMKIRTSDYRGMEAIPEYVKTHPGTGNRIAHVESILSDDSPHGNKARCEEEFRFDMIKYRLLGLYSDIEPTFQFLTAKLKHNPSDPAVHYGLGLVYARKFMSQKALYHLKKALSINIFDPIILLEMSRVYLQEGQPGKALNTLDGVDSDAVLNLMSQFYKANALLELRNLPEAEKLFNNVINKAPSLYPKAYYNLAKIMSIEKKPTLSHYYLGIYFFKTNNNKNALAHLNKAMETLKDKAKIKKTQTLLEQIKENRRTN